MGIILVNSKIFLWSKLMATLSARVFDSFMHCSLHQDIPWNWIDVNNIHKVVWLLLVLPFGDEQAQMYLRIFGHSWILSFYAQSHNELLTYLRKIQYVDISHKRTWKSSLSLMGYTGSGPTVYKLEIKKSYQVLWGSEHFQHKHNVYLRKVRKFNIALFY